jgi:hypothetical protein
MTMATAGRKPGGSGPTTPERKTGEMQESPPGKEEIEKRVKSRLKVEIVTQTEKGKPDTKINRYAATKSVVANLLKAQPDISICEREGSNSFSDPEEMPKDQMEFTKFFPTSVEDNRSFQKLTMEITVLSPRNIEEIKNSKDRAFFKYLVENSIYIKENKFDKLDVKEIGFIAGKSANLTWRPDFEKELHEALEKTTSALIPKFEVLPREMRYREKSGSLHGVKVLTIKCESDNADVLKAMLTDANLDKRKLGQFIPHGVSMNKLYEDGLQSQDDMDKDLTCIPVFGLAKEAMEAPMDGDHNLHKDMKSFLLDGIEVSEKVPLIEAIEQTNQTESDGKWMFICQAKHADAVKEYITSGLQQNYKESSKYDDEDLNTKKYPSPSVNRRTTPFNAQLDNYATAMMKTFPNFDSAASDNSQKKGNNNRRNQSNKNRGDTTTFDTTSDELFPALQGLNFTKKPNRNSAWNRTQEEKQKGKQSQALEVCKDAPRDVQELLKEIKEGNLKEMKEIKEGNLKEMKEVREEIRKEFTEQTKKMAEAQNKKMAEIKNEVRIEIGESLRATIMELFTRAFQQNTIGSGNTKHQLLKQFTETQQITASPGVSSPQYKKIKQKEAEDETKSEAHDSDRDELEAVQTLPTAFQQNTIESGNTKRQLLKELPETQQITASPGVSSPQYKKPKQKDAEDATMREANDSDSDEFEAAPTPPQPKTANSAGRRRLHLIDSRISLFRIAPQPGIQ